MRQVGAQNQTIRTTLRSARGLRLQKSEPRRTTKDYECMGSDLRIQ